MSQWMYRHNMQHEAYNAGKAVASFMPAEISRRFAWEFEKALMARGIKAWAAYIAAYPEQGIMEDDDYEQE